MSLIFEWWMNQIFICLHLLKNHFSDKVLWYHKFTVFTSHLTFMTKLPLKNHIFVHKMIHQHFVNYFNSLMVKMFSFVTPTVLSYNFVQKFTWFKNTHSSFILFILRISGLFPCVSIRTPLYLYWVIVWHRISAVVQHHIIGFIKSWRCQFYFLINLLCTALYCCKQPTFHKTVTI